MKRKTIAKASKKQVAIAFDYEALLTDVKSRIQLGQTRAVSAVNAELIRLYWDIGAMIQHRQTEEGYGTAVIPRLAKDIVNELPKIKGFSERNIGRMISFYRAYQQPPELLPQPVAKPRNLSAKGKSEVLPTLVAKVPQAVAQPLDSVLWLIPWGHHSLLIEKVKDATHRYWYMQQIITQGWSRNVLMLMINSDAHNRQGKLVSNFEISLPSPQSDLAQQALKDPYIFDFLTLTEPFKERELETGLLEHLQSFLIELGQGFAFVGRQYKIEVGDEDFYIDLLFYHLRLRCFVVIDLKRGAFKAEYAGKMNFYLNVVNDKLRHIQDEETIGLILCQNKDSVAAEYALRGMQNPIGVSDYQLTKALPKELQSSLPSIEEIEAELAGDLVGPTPMKRKRTKKKVTKASVKKETSTKRKGTKQ